MRQRNLKVCAIYSDVYVVVCNLYCYGSPCSKPPLSNGYDVRLLRPSAGLVTRGYVTHLEVAGSSPAGGSWLLFACCFVGICERACSLS